MKRVALDANVVLDVLLDRTNADRYAPLIQLIEAGEVRAIMALSALLEVDWTLLSTYKQSKQKRIRDLSVVCSLLDPSDPATEKLREGLGLYQQHEGVNLSDCLIALRASESDVDDLVTGDKKLARLYQSLKRTRRR